MEMIVMEMMEDDYDGDGDGDEDRKSLIVDL